MNYRSFGTRPGALVSNCSLFSRVSTARRNASRWTRRSRTSRSTPRTCWTTATVASPALSASGGSDVATYFLSGEYQKEQNVIEINAQQRLNIRTNLRGQLARNLDAQVSIGYNNSDLRRPQNDNNAFGVISGSLLGKAADCGPGGLAAKHPGLCGTRYGEPRLLQRRSRSESVLQHQHAPGGAAPDGRPDEQLDAAAWLSFNGTFGGDIDNRTDTETLPPAVLAYSQTTFDGSRGVYRAQVYNYTSSLNGQAV